MHPAGKRHEFAYSAHACLGIIRRLFAGRARDLRGTPEPDQQRLSGGIEMPIYEYQCQNCSCEVEKLQKLSDEPLRDCPQCGQPALKRKISAAGFRLKGAGWYETDFKKSGKKNLAGEGGASGSAGKSDTAAPASAPAAAAPAAPASAAASSTSTSGS
jgi:putative FmdB family regulatory protein